MKYYVILNESLLISENKNVLIEYYGNACELPEDYNEIKYKVVDGELVLNPNWEEEEEEQKQEKLSMLNLTSADVERGIYKAKGMDFDDIITLVEKSEAVGLDIKALKIELKANNFYRGNPYVNAVGKILGFTKEQLDKFFEDGNYEHLLPARDV